MYFIQLLEILDLKEHYFEQLQPWLENVVLPVYKKLMQEGSNEGSNDHEDHGGILAQEMVKHFWKPFRKGNITTKNGMSCSIY